MITTKVSINFNLQKNNFYGLILNECDKPEQIFEQIINNFKDIQSLDECLDVAFDSLYLGFKNERSKSKTFIRICSYDSFINSKYHIVMHYNDSYNSVYCELAKEYCALQCCHIYFKDKDSIKIEDFKK